MVTYNLDHLKQKDDQYDMGPIQDDEALFLFGLVRTMQIKRVMDIGAIPGGSSRNFCAAVGPDGIVYSVDKDPFEKFADNNVALVKDLAFVTPADVDNKPVEFVFFDCHAYEASLSFFQRFRRAGIINDRTVLGFHDTNLWPSQLDKNSYEVEGGWVFCPPERQLVNDFKKMGGYDVFTLTTTRDKHGPHLPYRAGVTIVQRYKEFDLKGGAVADWMDWEKNVSAQYRKTGDYDYEYIGPPQEG
jgi:hypothetical protein